MGLDKNDQMRYIIGYAWNKEPGQAAHRPLTGRSQAAIIAGIFLFGVMVAVGVSRIRDLGQGQLGQSKASNASIGAMIECPKMIELPVAARGGDVAFSYSVTNTNLFSAVNVVRVATSCGCTSADIENSLLAPGETTQVQAVITAPELQTGRSVRIAMVGDDGNMGETRVVVRSINPLDEDSVVFEGDTLRVTVRDVYDVDDFDWTCRRVADGHVLSSRFVHDDEEHFILDIDDPPTDGRLVVVFKAIDDSSRWYSQEIDLDGLRAALRED